ncbi:hypothetical protein DFJ73DRAFT_773015 [Zopfochytrium polystomum]|nr:hypothetical protein DFJ73DRAFT_773015 [Zopfochytrium polystomum]
MSYAPHRPSLPPPPPPKDNPPRPSSAASSGLQQLVIATRGDEDLFSLVRDYDSILSALDVAAEVYDSNTTAIAPAGSAAPSATQGTRSNYSNNSGTRSRDDSLGKGIPLDAASTRSTGAITHKSSTPHLTTANTPSTFFAPSVPDGDDFDLDFDFDDSSVEVRTVASSVRSGNRQPVPSPLLQSLHQPPQHLLSTTATPAISYESLQSLHRAGRITIYKAGSLPKLSSSHSTGDPFWKRRFIVLTHDALHAFRDPVGPSSSSIGHLQLDFSSVVGASVESQFAFDVKTLVPVADPRPGLPAVEYRIWSLKCTGKEAVAAWIAATKLCLSQFRARRQQGGGVSLVSPVDGVSLERGLSTAASEMYSTLGHSSFDRAKDKRPAAAPPPSVVASSAAEAFATTASAAGVSTVSATTTTTTTEKPAHTTDSDSSSNAASTSTATPQNHPATSSHQPVGAQRATSTPAIFQAIKSNISLTDLLQRDNSVHQPQQSQWTQPEEAYLPPLPQAGGKPTKVPQEQQQHVQQHRDSTKPFSSLPQPQRLGSVSIPRSPVAFPAPNIAARSSSLAPLATNPIVPSAASSQVSVSSDVLFQRGVLKQNSVRSNNTNASARPEDTGASAPAPQQNRQPAASSSSSYSYSSNPYSSTPTTPSSSASFGPFSQSHHPFFSSHPYVSAAPPSPAATPPLANYDAPYTPPTAHSRLFPSASFSTPSPSAFSSAPAPAPSPAQSASYQPYIGSHPLHLHRPSHAYAPSPPPAVGRRSADGGNPPPPLQPPPSVVLPADTGKTITLTPYTSKSFELRQRYGDSGLGAGLGGGGGVGGGGGGAAAAGGEKGFGRLMRKLTGRD